MAAGVRSLLAFWAGGAAVPAAVSQGSVRSLLAPWMGGATAPAVVEQGGVRGLLAFWMGGAAPGAAAPEAPIQQQSPAGRMRVRVSVDDEEEIMLLIHAALHMLNHEHV